MLPAAFDAYFGQSVSGFRRLGFARPTAFVAEAAQPIDVRAGKHFVRFHVVILDGDVAQAGAMASPAADFLLEMLAAQESSQ